MRNVRTLLKSAMASFVALAAMTVWAAPATAASLEEVLAAHVEAVGGADAINAIKSISRTGEVFMDGQFGIMEGTSELVMIPGLKVYTNMDLGVFARAEAYDGEIGWRDDTMNGIQDVEGDDLNTIKNQRYFSRLAEMAVAGDTEKLSLAADETIDGKDFYVIEMADEKAPAKLYIDKATNLAARMTVSTENPQFGPVEIIIEQSEYEVHNGVQLAGFNKMILGELFTLETTFTETEINGEIDESIFEKPVPPAPMAPVTVAPSTDAPSSDASSTDTPSTDAPSADDAE